MPKLLAFAKKRKELDPAMEIVDHAINQLDPGSNETEEAEFVVERLNELKRHMDFVNAIFHAFVGAEADLAGLADVIKIKEDRN